MGFYNLPVGLEAEVNVCIRDLPRACKQEQIQRLKLFP